jgi:hypothetical protein
MIVPTQGETYAKMMEHLRLAQECAAMMAHLTNANDDRRIAHLWIKVSEGFRNMQHHITELAQKGLQ